MSEQYVHGYTEEEQERLRRLNVLLNSKCLEKLNLDGLHRVLDLGSGLGILTRDIARGCKAQVIGLEFEEKQLRVARLLAKEERVSDLVQYVQGSVYELEEKFEDKFDLIFTRFLFEHLANVPAALEQCYRALRPGGRLVVVDDDHANFRVMPEPGSFGMLWKAYCKVFENEGQDPYIGRRLVSLLHAAGFRNIELDFIRFGAAREQEHFDLYAENLIGIVLGAREQILTLADWNEDLFEAAIRELIAWKKQGDAALWYAVNWAEGRRL